MKKLETNPNGGFPLESDDVRWLQAGNQQIVTALLAGLANGVTDSILSGCNVSVTSFSPFTYTMTEGWLLINGEICFAPAVTTSTIVAGAAVWFDVIQQYDAGGLEDWGDSVPRNKWTTNLGGIAGGAVRPAGRIQVLQYEPITSFTRKVLNTFLPLDFKHTGTVFLNNGTANINTYIANFLEYDDTTSPSGSGANTFIVGFDGSVPALRVAQGPAHTGALYWLQFKKTSGTSNSIVINHNDAITGFISFWTKNGCNITINDGDCVMIYYDGMYHRIISNHKSAPINIPLTSPWGIGTQGYINKSSEGLVKISGTYNTTGITSGSDSILGTLPVGYRPGTAHSFAITTGPSGGTMNCYILSNGEIHIVNVTGTTQVSAGLDNVSFYAGE